MSDTPSPPGGTTRETSGKSERETSGKSERDKVAKAVISTVERRVRWACYLSLVALALITWSLVSKAPLAVIAAMTIGQILGTLSLLFFLGSIALDLRARYRIEKKGILPDSLRSPPPGEG